MLSLQIPRRLLEQQHRVRLAQDYHGGIWKPIPLREAKAASVRQLLWDGAPTTAAAAAAAAAAAWLSHLACSRVQQFNLMCSRVQHFNLVRSHIATQRACPTMH